MQIPAPWAFIYQGLLPTWDGTFQFWTNPNEAPISPLVGPGSAVVGLSAGLLAGIAVWLVRRPGRAASDSIQVDVAEEVPPDQPSAVAEVRVDPGIASGSRVSGVEPVRPGSGHDLGAAISARRLAGSDTGLTLLGITIAVFLAALVVGRVGGPDGPWLWNIHSSVIAYPYASAFHDAMTRGIFPPWDLVGALYPPNWIAYLLPPLVALDVSRFAHLLLAGIGVGVITLRISGSRTGAVASALVVVLAGGIASKLDLPSVVIAYGWMPWVLLPVIWTRGLPLRRMVLLAGVASGLQALAGDLGIWALTAAAALVVVFASGQRSRALGLAVMFTVVAVLVGAPHLLPGVTRPDLLGVSLTPAGLTTFGGAVSTRCSLDSRMRSRHRAQRALICLRLGIEQAQRPRSRQPRSSVSPPSLSRSWVFGCGGRARCFYSLLLASRRPSLGQVTATFS